MFFARFLRFQPAICVLAIGLLIGGVAAACGDDDAGTSTPAPSATAVQSSTTVATGSATASVPGATSGVLGALQQKMFSGSYEITYDMSTDPTSGLALNGTFTLGSKPPATLIGINGKILGSNGSYVLIDDGTSSYTCINAQGQKTCLKSKSGGAANTGAPINVLSIKDLVQQVAADPTATTTPLPAQTIAGLQANCYQVQGSSASGTTCIASNEGVLLSLDGTYSGTKLTMTATNVNLSPADGDFQPPYPVTTLAGN